MSNSNVDNEVVLCGASSYNKKYYLNQNFTSLPQSIQDELRIMCVLYTEEVGGVLELVFDKNGTLEFKTSSKEGDLLYDDIGSILKIKQLQKTKIDLLESLELYYRVVILGEGFDQED